MPRQKLSDALLKGSKLGSSEGQVDYWTLLLPALAFASRPAGRKSFVVLTRIGGHIRRFTLKPPYPSLSLADAEGQAATSSRMDRLGLTPSPRRGPGARQQLRSGCYRLRRRACTTLAHGQGVRAQDRCRTLPQWGDRPMEASPVPRSRRCCGIRHAKVPSLRSAGRRSRLFAWALEEEIIEASPATPYRGSAWSRKGNALLQITRSASCGMRSPVRAILSGRSSSSCSLPGSAEVKRRSCVGQRSKAAVGCCLARVPNPVRVTAFRCRRLGLRSRQHSPNWELVFSSRSNRPLQGWSKVKIRINDSLRRADS